MEKRYQVFVSSTYADLKEERSKVIQTIMEMDCIPSGMELFPAIDEEQFEFIKRIIDDCDYYVLIIGGRYGSMTSDGISFTEKEYEYALQTGLKVIAFIHRNPDDIPVGKSDIDPIIREKLNSFREKVANGRLVKFWDKPEDLPGLLALSLSKTIKMYPAIGWVRATEFSNEDLLLELNSLRKDNISLSQKLSSISNTQKPKISNLAPLDATIITSGDKFTANGYSKWEHEISWSKIFQIISPFLLDHPNDATVKSKLGSLIYEDKAGYTSSANLNEQDFQTIKIQLSALGLVQVNYNKTTKGGMALFWVLTQTGSELMTELRAIKSKE